MTSLLMNGPCENKFPQGGLVFMTVLFSVGVVSRLRADFFNFSTLLKRWAISAFSFLLLLMTRCVMTVVVPGGLRCFRTLDLRRIWPSAALRVGPAPLVLGLTLITQASWCDSLAFNVGSNGTFGVLDLSTGALTQTGNIGFTPAGLGEIGSTLFTAAYGGTGLYSVNTLTGNLTQFSNLGLNGAGFNTLGSTTTGLYALDNSFNLYNINLTTGVGTLIGPTGVATGVLPGSYGFSLSTGSSTLYFEDGFDLYSLNTTNGSGTLIGQASAPGIGFNSLVSENGTLYGVNSSTISPYNTLYTINTLTGVGTLDGTLNPDVEVASYGLAPDLLATPEPAPLSLMALAFSLGLIAIAWRRSALKQRPDTRKEIGSAVPHIRNRLGQMTMSLVLLSGLAATAFGDTVLPGAIASVTANADKQSASLTTPPSNLPLLATAQDIYSSAQAAASGGLDPSIAVAAAVVGGNMGERASATSNLTYSLEVSGPTIAAVKVDVMAVLTASIGSYIDTSAALTILGPTDSIDSYLSSLELGAAGHAVASDIVATDAVLEPGVIYQVVLTASASAIDGGFCSSDCEGAVSGAAAVDPTFTIDPHNPNASEYSIVTSDNLTSVPEPPTGIFIGIGMFGLCVRCWLRRIRS